MPATTMTSFVLSIRARYPSASDKRGTVEFDTPAGAQISVLGMRITLGNKYAHYDSSTSQRRDPEAGVSRTLLRLGDGWQSTFVLVNTGTSAAHRYASLLRG